MINNRCCITFNRTTESSLNLSELRVRLIENSNVIQHLHKQYFNFLTQVGEEWKTRISYSFICPTNFPPCFSRFGNRIADDLNMAQHLLQQYSSFSHADGREMENKYIFPFSRFNVRTIKDFNIMQHLSEQYFRFSNNGKTLITLYQSV